MLWWTPSDPGIPWDQSECPHHYSKFPLVNKSKCGLISGVPKHALEHLKFGRGGDTDYVTDTPVLTPMVSKETITFNVCFMAFISAT